MKIILQPFKTKLDIERDRKNARILEARALRREGKSLKEIAEELHYCPSYVSKITQGAQRPAKRGTKAERRAMTPAQVFAKLQRLQPKGPK